MHSPRRYNIPLEVLLEAKKCIKQHACLTDNEYKLCGIRLTTENASRMICGSDDGCPYKSQLGKETVCTCPVRHAIHNKYGI
jgi:hypothetical protein